MHSSPFRLSFLDHLFPQLSAKSSLALPLPLCVSTTPAVQASDFLQKYNPCLPSNIPHRSCSPLILCYGSQVMFQKNTEPLSGLGSYVLGRMRCTLPGMSYKVLPNLVLAPEWVSLGFLSGDLAEPAYPLCFLAGSSRPPLQPSQLTAFTLTCSIRSSFCPLTCSVSVDDLTMVQKAEGIISELHKQISCLPLKQLSLHCACPLHISEQTHLISFPTSGLFLNS